MNRPKANGAAKTSAAGGKFQAASPSGSAAQSKKPGASRGYPRKKRNRTRVYVIIALCVILLAALGVGGVYAFDKLSDDGRILDNVYAAGIDLGKMTREEATQVLQNFTKDTYTVENLIVQLPDCKLVLSPEDTGAKLDIDKLVEDAWNYGREGGVFARAKARSAAKLSSYTLEILPYLNLNTDYISNLVNQFAQEVASELTQPSLELSGQRPEADSEQPAEGQKLTVTMGTAQRSIDAEELYDRILKAYNTNDFTPIEVSYTETLPEAPDLEAAYKEYCTPAVDAVLDEDTYEVTAEEPGYGFILEDAQKLVDEAKEGDIVEIPFQTLEPEVTKAKLEENLFKDTLAQVKSVYPQIPQRTNNLRLACKELDGYIIKPGATFSFNEVVGERTVEKGYKEATIYSGGLSVPALGGGVCQVASTIYLACLYADMDIVERACHQFIVDYVPMGMDATIYWGSYDFKFKNNTDYPIRMKASVDDTYVHITLIGTDTKSYTVEMNYEIVSTSGYTTQYREIKPGSSDYGKYYDGQVIVQPYTGYKVKTYKTRIDKVTGKKTTDWEADSVYDSRNKIIAKVIEPEKPTEPKPTEPKPTEPKPTEPKPTDPPVTDPPVTDPPPESDPPSGEE